MRTVRNRLLVPVLIALALALLWRLPQSMAGRALHQGVAVRHVTFQLPDGKTIEIPILKLNLAWGEAPPGVYGDPCDGYATHLCPTDCPTGPYCVGVLDPGS